MTHSSLQPPALEIIEEANSLEEVAGSPILSSPREQDNRYLSYTKFLPAVHHRSADDIRSTNRLRSSDMADSSTHRSRHSTYTFPETDDILHGLLSHDIGACRVCASVDDLAAAAEENRYLLPQWHPSIDPQQSRRRSGSLADVERTRLSTASNSSCWGLGDIQEQEESSPQMPRRDLNQSVRSSSFLSPPSIDSSTFSSTESLLLHSASTPFIPEGVIVLDDECIFRYPSQFHAQLGRGSRRSSSTTTLSNLTDATSPNQHTSHSASLPLTPILTINGNNRPLPPDEQTTFASRPARVPDRKNSHSLKVPNNSGWGQEGREEVCERSNTPDEFPSDGFRHPRSPKRHRRSRKNISPKMVRRAVRDESANHSGSPATDSQTMPSLPRAQSRRGSVLDLFSPSGSLSRRISVSTDIGAAFARKSMRKKRRKSNQHQENPLQKSEDPPNEEKDKHWISRLLKSTRMGMNEAFAVQNSSKNNFDKGDKVPQRRYSLAGHEQPQQHERGL